jgi:demethylmenaquinone methyltransferase/2-methoxy-6-polyprenyl-1,4-benzoquinol methylase/ArsR family transcriptional regulator
MRNWFEIRAAAKPGAGEAGKLTVSLWLGRDRRAIAESLPLTTREVA